MFENTELLCIIGPTASGKTALSLELARVLEGEIISVDSRQVYRFMDVGTDKVSRKIRSEIPHHMIDVVDPDGFFSAADFVKGAERVTRDILSRGKTPILAGGTPFYFRALFSGLLSADLESWPEVRKEYETRWRDGEAGALYERLKSEDPIYAVHVHRNDAFRVIRALSIIEKTGQNPTYWRKKAMKRKNTISPLYIGLYPGRKMLYSTIEKRVREQFSKGYPEEVETLLSRGYGEDLPSMRGFGYRELAAYHSGRMTLEEAIEGDIRSTRAFARRQMTWFRRFSPCLWYYVSGSGITEQARKVIDLWRARH
ncbi:MAG TPA: tRNA (adenosine(37)-N6)-dimethylallyltransferase MiaA [Synergistetes bacterium]|nr:tRNA (adenosine(37)-N6)-dimethylallyltransferase MiaA [Synergistota bacterium]